MQHLSSLLFAPLFLLLLFAEKCNESATQNTPNPAPVEVVESEPTTPQNTPTTAIQNDSLMPTFYVGTGGGFTGKVTEYKIESGGKVLVVNGLKNDTTFLKQLIDSDLAAIKTDYQATDWTSIDFNIPGNLYYFLAIPSTEETGKLHRITWGHHSKKPPVIVQDFYTKVLQIIKKPVDQ